MGHSKLGILIWWIVNKVSKVFNFSDVFSIVIIVIAIFSFWKVHKEQYKNIRAIKIFINNKENIKGDPLKKLHIIKEKDFFNKNNYLYDLWDKYIVYAMNNSIQGRYPDISNYFNKFNIIDLPGKRKIAEIIPGILTALGILGTFLGLQEGISYINTDSPEKVKESIRFLTSGMSMAFITSIVGIICSTIWSRLDKMIYERSIRVLNKFYSTFREKYRVYNSEYFFNEILELEKSSTDAIKHMATDLSLELSKVLSKSINETIIPNIDASINNIVNRDLKPTFETMSDMVDNFTSKVSENQMDGINNMTTAFLEKLNSAINIEFDNLANAIDEITKWNIETKNSLEELLEEIKETVLNQQEIKVSSEEIISRYSELFDRFMQTNDILEKNLRNINETVEKIEEIFIQSVDVSEQLSTIQKDSYNLIELIKNNIEGLRENWDNSKASLEIINEKLDESAITFSESLKDGLDATFNAFDEGLSEISKRLSGSILEIQETVDELPRVVSLLTKELDNATVKLNNSVEDINSFYKEIINRINELKGDELA